MIEINAKLTGNLDGALDKFAQNVQEKVLFSGVAAMAKVVYDEAQNKVPVKTGLLKSSIYRVYSKDRSTDQKKTYQISWNKKKAPHGHLVEFGTSRAAAHPFIRPAFDHIQEAIAAGKEAMAKKLTEENTKP
jgi:HK97 gp10 family phage protein